MKPLTLDDAAEIEFQEALLEYATYSETAASRFRRRVEHALAEIQENPRIGARLERGGVRYLRVRALAMSSSISTSDSGSG